MSTNTHVLAVPSFLFPIRVAQAVLAVVILGLTGYGITYFAFDGDSLMLFTAIASLIIVAYILASTIKLHAFYNYWAALGLDIFATFFWLISFSLLASEVASLSSALSIVNNYCFDGFCDKKKREIVTHLARRLVYTNGYTYRNVLAAASALGALEFVLFAIALAFTGLALHRHRASGGHCLPGSTNAGVTNNNNYNNYNNGAMAHESKPVEMQPNHGHQQVPVYAQQPDAAV